LLAAACVLAVARPARCPAATPDSVAVRTTNVDPLLAEYFERWFDFHPEEATRLGLHRWDGKLVPITQASVEAETAWLHEFRQRLVAVNTAKLAFPRRLDHAALLAAVDRRLFDLEVTRSFERNPNLYVSLITSPIQALLERSFASDCSRLHSAVKRLRAVPEVLRAATINLKNPPRIYTDVAIDQLRGALRFYRETVPEMAGRCKDAPVQADVAEADSQAVRAAADFLDYLESDLRPRSTGEIAFGRDAVQRKLWADERESAPVESLLTRGWYEIGATRERMRALARRIAPSGEVQDALDSLARDTPEPSQQLALIRAEVDTVRLFLRGHAVLSRPHHEHLIVRETPTFSRSLNFASLDPPGVWESNADEAYLNVTPVDSTWSETQKRDHLAFFNRWNAAIVVVHEALPGHYYQFLSLRNVNSRVRAALGCRSNIEGWAHYCEQMMVEEGFGGGNPRTALAQEWLALQRLGRLVAGLSIHTAGMSVTMADSLFQNQCWMTPITAAREARRGALDPTYGVYTLGKWRILALRDEVRAAMGDHYSARAFHDALLAQGIAPLPIVRAGVLHALTGRTVDPGAP